MASDEEIARELARLGHGDTSGSADSGDARPVDRASEIHDELARRIERVAEDAADEAAVTGLRERLDRLEARVDALE